MRVLQFLGFALLLVVVSAVLVTADEPPLEGNDAPAWQHLALAHDGADITADPKLARRINELGDAGWELVNVSTAEKDGSTVKTTFFFKRPK